MTIAASTMVAMTMASVNTTVLFDTLDVSGKRNAYRSVPFVTMRRAMRIWHQLIDCTKHTTATMIAQTIPISREPSALNAFTMATHASTMTAMPSR